MRVRPAQPGDHDAIWSVIGPTIRAGEVFALPRDMTRDAALAYWRSTGHEVFVATDNDDEDENAGGTVLGTYYLRPNQPGGGGHVANAGYATAPAATGRGVARAMCGHSIEHARRRGYRAMQFNFVVRTNERAVRLWQGCGFRVVGTLPGAFEHPTLGFVDALVMFREL